MVPPRRPLLDDQKWSFSKGFFRSRGSQASLIGEIMIIHFFKAKSRIGLRNKPIHQKEFNLGVEDGSDYMLSENFLNQLNHNSLDDRTPSCYKISSFRFPKPEDIGPLQFNKTLAKSVDHFKEIINQTNNDRVIQVVIGGDHMVVLPSILADLAKGIKPEDIGLIHFDSHGDINLSADSPTDNFHGMYLRPLFDKFDIPEIEALVPNKIPTKNLLMIGNLDLDQGEKTFMANNAIKTISGLDIENDRARVLEEFKVFVSQFSHLHISFDIDCLDKSIAPATGIPAENGLFLEEIQPLLEVIKEHGQFSFDLCEVNPKKRGSRTNY